MFRICRSNFVWLLLFLLICACSAHFGGARLDTTNLYTARGFLVGAEAEPTDYGLYSYLLFPTLPTAKTKARYEAAIRSFLAQPPPPAADELRVHENLNIFYLLLIDKPDRQVKHCLRSNCYPLGDEIVTAILSQYNYARARITATRLGLRIDLGPYIVTTKGPISISSEGPPRKAVAEALFQDLSVAPVHLVSPWMTLFIQKATGKGSGFNQNLRELLLQLQTSLENYAQGLPKVFKAEIVLAEFKNHF